MIAGIGGALGGLDQSTFGFEVPSGECVVNLWYEADEAYVYRRAATSRRSRGSSAEPDVERSRISAASRARNAVRRYIAANQLRLAPLLTWATVPSSVEVARAAVKGFFGRLGVKVFGSQPFPYLWVPELAPTEGRLHVHSFLLPEIGDATVTAAWTEGQVRIKRLDTGDDMRNMAEYVSKGFIDGPVLGPRRYYSDPEFKPQPERISVSDIDHGLSVATDRLGPIAIRRLGPDPDHPMAALAFAYF